MRCKALLTAAGLAFVPLLGLSLARGAELDGINPPDKAPASCATGKYGTTIDFVSTPSEAARLAKKEEKLVFVLHLSGIFEDPNFT